MIKSTLMPSPTKVALRKESVDRNRSMPVAYRDAIMSISARRAWIEMFDFPVVPSELTVALRKESVDRNIPLITLLIMLLSRSPQGERG